MANNKAASYFQQDFIANLGNSFQFPEQALLWKLL